VNQFAVYAVQLSRLQTAHADFLHSASSFIDLKKIGLLMYASSSVRYFYDSIVYLCCVALLFDRRLQDDFANWNKLILWQDEGEICQIIYCLFERKPPVVFTIFLFSIILTVMIET
jgi:hypothetical protein